MKINRKLLLVLLLLMICLFSSNLIYRQFFLKKTEILFDERYTEEKGDVHHILSFYREQLESYILSFTFWDDMVDYAAHPDSAWFEKNIDNTLATNHVDAVWIFNKKEKLVHYANANNQPELKNLIEEKDISPAAIRQHGDNAHFFVKTDDGYFEMSAASILYSDDTLHNKPAEGYLYVAKLVSPRYLQKMDEITCDQVSLEPETNILSDTEQLISRNDSQFVFRKGIRDLQGNYIGAFHIIGNTSALRSLISSFVTVQNFSFVIWVLLLLVVVILVLFWISRPLNKISESLETNDDTLIEPYAKNSDEFGNIARLIKRFVHQHGEIEQAREIAERESTAKSEFLALISHELRTPLQSIIGMGDMVKQTKLNNVQQEYVNTMQTNSDLLLSLINEVLDFSRLNSNEIKLKEGEIDLQGLLDELIDIFSLAANEKQIGLYYLSDPDVPTRFVTDPLRLRQTLVNLLNNAIKFTDNGSIHLGISCRERKEDHFLIQFEVRDTGQGISESDKKRIFQPFFQAEDFSRRKKGGTGLGLAITQRLVNLMQGEIWFESQRGKGSVFSFYIRVTTTPLSVQPAPDLTESVPVFLLSNNEELNENLGQVMSLWNVPYEVVENEENLPGKLEQVGRSVVIADRELLSDIRRISEIIKPWRDTNTVKLLALMRDNPGEFLRLADENIIDEFAKVPIKHGDIYDKITSVFYAGRNHIKQETMITETPPIHLKILVTEDHKMNQHMLRHFISKVNATATFVDSGKEAIATLRKEPFDLVLMDLSMPEMDGITATKLILDDPQIRQKPVIIALTAHASSEDRQKCFDAGMKDFMTKPVTLENFRQMILKWNEELKK